MQELDLCLLGLLPLFVGMGGWSIWWVRGNHDEGKSLWGQRLFIGSLLGLGAGNLVALTWAAHCLLPFGLSAGWLVIAMLWENPFATS